MFSTSTWQELDLSLPVTHTLTITALKWSPDDSLLASGGRDRQLILYRRIDESLQVIGRSKLHSRVIWSVDFLPHSDTHRCSQCNRPLQFLASASRDKSIHLYNAPCCSPSDLISSHHITFHSSVTAIAFIPIDSFGFIAAIGFESGDIELWKFHIGDVWSSSCVSRFDQRSVELIISRTLAHEILCLSQIRTQGCRSASRLALHPPSIHAASAGSHYDRRCL